MNFVKIPNVLLFFCHEKLEGGHENIIHNPAPNSKLEKVDHRFAQPQDSQVLMDKHGHRKSC